MSNSRAARLYSTSSYRHRANAAILPRRGARIRSRPQHRAARLSWLWRVTTARCRRPGVCVDRSARHPVVRPCANKTKLYAMRVVCFFVFSVAYVPRTMQQSAASSARKNRSMSPRSTRLSAGRSSALVIVATTTHPVGVLSALRSNLRPHAVSRMARRVSGGSMSMLWSRVRVLVEGVRASPRVPVSHSTITTRAIQGMAVRARGVDEERQQQPLNSPQIACGRFYLKSRPESPLCSTRPLAF